MTNDRGGGLSPGGFNPEWGGGIIPYPTGGGYSGGGVFDPGGFDPTISFFIYILFEVWVGTFRECYFNVEKLYHYQT